MKNIYTSLSWLPKTPNNFSDQLALADSPLELKRLAGYALDGNQLGRLSKKLNNFQVNGVNIAPLIPVSIGLIGNATTKLLIPSLLGTALRYGIALNVVEADFNQVAQEAFSDESKFSGHKLSAIVIAIDYRGLPLSPTPGDRFSADKNIEDCLGYIKSIAESLGAKTGAQIILQNFAAPVEALFGSYEGRLPGTLSWLIARLNCRLDDLVADNTFILDVAGLASNIGISEWHDPIQWNLAKLPFAQHCTPIYSDYICRILSARLGKSRRCLILDLDNTLWGGVIGDDGLEGILIGTGNPTAEAHLNVQQTAMDLRARGIVLSISSKNEDATARLPFKKHPDMILKENHIAVFQANWSDKASNIKAISDSLALGLESMVFLDDNPAERMQVRKELPEVAVPELPDDPALYARTLLAAGYFEAVRFSEEDGKRASFYQDNAKRAQILSQATDIRGYLESLDMEVTFAKFDDSGRARISQLISKSNQFNLTTRRYSESDIKNIQQNPSYFSRQIRLKDILGDNGMISVVICKINNDFWEIDTWLMSCRVLGRQVEEAALLDLVENAKKMGANKIIGEYKPTSRNVIVKDHYDKLGFKRVSSSSEGELWELDFSNYKKPNLPMKYKYVD